MFKVFVDGESGTTGLQIVSRLESHPHAELLRIDPDKRRDPAERKTLINRADVVFLCLPDDAARESAALAENPDVRVIDASTAHRVAEGWTYGLPEMARGQRDRIRAAKRVSVPGCHATCLILAVRPLVENGVITPDFPVIANSVTGYSGAGKPTIVKYEDGARAAYYQASRPYALGMAHKHLPEMTRYAMLSHPPLFEPIICDFYKGMAVTVMLPVRALNKRVTPASLREMYARTYSGERFVSVSRGTPDELDEGCLNPMALNGTNDFDIGVFGNEEQIAVIARLDNLGKGSSGAAVQCMNLMMGADEDCGL